MFDKNKFFAVFSATAATLFLGLNAHDTEAASISKDSSFWVDTATRNTDSGLEWLDPTESPRLSVNQARITPSMAGNHVIRMADTAHLPGPGLASDKAAQTLSDKAARHSDRRLEQL